MTLGEQEPASASNSPAASRPEPFDVLLKCLARGEAGDFGALLHDVERHAVVDGTRITAHCHCIRLDGNGRPRVEALVEAVAEHVLDYAIPRREYREAQEEAARTGSSQKVVRLHSKARRLFTDLLKSGEGGELLLFALAEKLLRLPQLICKMSLKTNDRMHIHGADGLHAGVDEETGKLLLYWGESKIFTDVTSAVRDCLKSLAPMLTDHEASKRDLHLLQRHLDVDNEELENALKKFLDPDDPSFNSLEFCGLCLVGFDCDAYPAGPSTIELTEVVNAITATLPAWKTHLAKRVSEENLDAFSMHFLFVPFPSSEEFRALFRKQLGLNTEAQNDASPATESRRSVAKTSSQATASRTPDRTRVRKGSPPARSRKRGNSKGGSRGTS